MYLVISIFSTVKEPDAIKLKYVSGNISYSDLTNDTDKIYKLPKGINKPTELYIKSLRPKGRTKHWIGNNKIILDYWLQYDIELIDLFKLESIDMKRFHSILKRIYNIQKDDYVLRPNKDIQIQFLSKDKFDLFISILLNNNIEYTFSEDDDIKYYFITLSNFQFKKFILKTN